MRSLPLLFALAACAPVDVAPVDALVGASPPPVSTLRLAVSSVVPGQTVAVKIRGLNPNERVYLLRGTGVGAGVCPAVAGGLCLDVTGAPSVMRSANADATGAVDWTFPVPVVPLGFDVAFQAVALRGPGAVDSTKSNPVLREVLASPASAVTDVGQLVITEVMADPSAVGDADGEWFEVLNASGAPLDLLGLGLGDAGGVDETVGLPAVLMPGEHATLAKRGDPAVNGGFWPTYVYGASISLSNAGDTLSVFAAGSEVDAVTWTAAPVGAAWSLDPAFTDPALNDDGSLWCDAPDLFGAGDGGSPNLANPSCGTCGDGVVGPGEACDDGGEVDGDGCDSVCEIEIPPDGDGDGFIEPADCDDANAAVFPGALELCDGLDNDCDAATSEEGQIRVNGLPGVTTVAQAVSTAPYGAVVELCAGIYPVNNVALPTGITLRGQGPTQTIVDGGGLGRVFSLAADRVTIEGMTIQGGRLSARGDTGAGLAIGCPGFPCDPSQRIVVRNVAFRGHSSPFGVGAAVSISGPISTAGDSTLTLDDCVFEQNTSAGAALNVAGSVVTVINTSFRDNTSTQDGGAIDVYEGVVDGHGLTFHNNEAGSYGGAISVFYGGTFECFGCDFGFGATENTPDDIATYDGAIRQYTAYGAGASMTCSVGSQPNAVGTGRCVP